MGIKDLFDSENTKILTSTTLEEEHEAIESIENIKQKRLSKERFIPQVDFSKPENFAHYGSAERYYENSMKRVLNQYPYDGSEAEIQGFLNNSTYVDLYVLDKKYPRTNGYIKFSATGWGTLTGSVIKAGWGAPSTTGSIGHEYIDIRGGPHTASGGMIGKDLADVFAKSNIYDTDIYDTEGVLSLDRDGSRESNLQFNISSSGGTFEFWFKKAHWNAGLTSKEVVFDLWNQEPIGSSQYGRVLLFLSGASSTTSTMRYQINSGSTLSSLLASSGSVPLLGGKTVDDDWHHFAVVFKQNGSNLDFRDYLDGTPEGVTDASIVFNDMSGSWKLRLGALQTAPEGITPDKGEADGMSGYGKLSASLDEFRYWKTVRTEKEINENLWKQVRGGTNTDISNTNLGVYLKFNEGITNIGSIDSTVLDYSGRISNGVWTGYPGSSARNTGSAMVEASVAASEYLDPIIYEQHPEYSATVTALKDSGSVHDSQNSSRFIDLLPAWVIDQDLDEGSEHLHNLTQIMSSYFDTLHLQIESLSKIKNASYITSSIKPLPFADRLLESQGMVAPEIFIDSTITEHYMNHDGEREFELDLTDIKNHIYKNIYNNLIHLYKSKGTEKAYRNLLRCYGIGDEIVKFNTYANNQTFKIEDTHYLSSCRKKYIDFSSPNKYGAVVINATASSIGGHLSVPTHYNVDMAVTDEVEVIFPNNPDTFENNRVFKTFTTASIFGYHIVSGGPAASIMEWTASAKDSNYELYAVRPLPNSSDAYFWLTDRNRTFNLTSSLYTDVYSGEKWNFAIRQHKEQHPIGTQISGAVLGHIWEFLGFNVDGGIVKNQFNFSASLSSAHKGLATKGRKYYAGANRTNFTGTLQTQTDVKISSVRSWHSYLSNDVLIAHAKDPNNFGTGRPTRNTQFFNSSITSILPEYATLRFAWEMNELTTSDNNGEFRITDFSSGSGDFIASLDAGYTNAFGHHDAHGYLFPASSTTVVSNEYINAAKQKLPEVIDSSDMVNVLTQDDEIFTRDPAVSQHVFAFEKSMYGVVSQEILNIFAGVTHMNDLIGEVTNKYRSGYKDMRLLRELFFEKVRNTPDLDNFMDYYRWIDSSIMKFLKQLTPGSAILSDDIRNIVESHILERNKYDHKYPFLDFRGNTRWAETTIEGSVKGLGELEYNWKYGHAPVDNNDADNALWWKTRARANDTVLTSGDTTKDVQRQRLRAAINNDSFASPVRLREVTNSKYRSVVNSLRDFRTVMKPDIIRTKTIKGGINFENNKKFSVFKNLIMNYPTGLSDSGYELDIVKKADKNINDIEDPSKLVRKNWGIESYFDKVTTFASGGSQFFFDNAEKVIPGNLISSSVVSGYNASNNNSYNRSALNSTALTNIHFDAYGTELETPMQGPFSDAHVGGLQHRHVKMNRGSDTLYTRPEAWRMRSFPTDSMLRYKNPSVNPLNDVENPAYPIAIYYRDETAKRPVVIKNVKYTTGSAILGNYRREMEIVPITGRKSHNKSFIQNEGFSVTGVSSSFVTDLVDYTKPLRTTNSGTTYPGKNNSYAQHVIVQRFSAPGSPETMGDHQGGSGLDVEAGEYSPYNSLNYRNLSVRQPLNRSLLVHHTRQFGFYSGSAVTSANYAGTGSYHKQHRNRGLRMEYSQARSPVDAAVITASVFDNAFISSLIPRSDLHYAWVTASYESTKQVGFAPPTGFVSTSAGRVNAIAFSSGSEIGAGKNASGQLKYGFYGPPAPNITTDFVFNDYVGLNTNIREPINTSSYDFVGFTASGGEIDPSTGRYRYLNEVYIDGITGQASNPYTLNGLLHHRNGPYQHANFKTIAHQTHPIVRRQRKDNVITHTIEGGVERIIAGSTTKDTNGKTKVFIEPAINNKYKPIKIDMVVVTGEDQNNDTKTSNIVASVSVVGKNLFFENPELNNLIGLRADQETPYDKIKKMYLDGALKDPNSPIVDIKRLIYTETVYPAGKNAHLKKTRGRTSFNNNFWRSTREDRNVTGSYSTISGQYSASFWPLDAATSYTLLGNNAFAYTNSAGAWSLYNPESQYNRMGELMGQWYYDLRYLVNNIGTPDFSRMKALPMYYRPHKIYFKNTLAAPYNKRYDEMSTTGAFQDLGGALGGGQAVWETGRLAGKFVNGEFVYTERYPFHDTYDDYSLDIKNKAKGYSVLPEFRISEHINMFYKDGGESTLQENSKEYSIYGIPTASSNPQNSSENDFFEIYSNSDFMKYFELVKNDNKGLLQPATISLKCKGIKKFLPYEGFYPVLRTLDLATQFSKSYEPYIKSRGADSQYDNVRLRTVLAPMFAPGILYNTVKSGLAVDFPVMTGSIRASHTHKVAGGAGDLESIHTTIGSNSRYKSALPASSNHVDGWDYRIPFEAIINPENFISNKWIADSEKFNSNQDITASLGLGGDNLYTMMVNNFFAETIDFFLEEQTVTKIVSKPESEFKSVTPGQPYGMRVKVWRTMDGPKPVTGSWGQFPIPQNSGSAIKESFVMYSRPSAFGPPVSATGSNNAGAPRSWSNWPSGTFGCENGVYASHTPPYYDGESWIDIIYYPWKTTAGTDAKYNSDVNKPYKPSLDEILNFINPTASIDTTAGFPGGTYVRKWRYDREVIDSSTPFYSDTEAYHGPMAGAFANRWSMQADASFVIDEREKDKWSIKSRFETPMLNFAYVTSSDGTKTIREQTGDGRGAEASSGIGMWHQFGRIPKIDEGVYLQITDIPENWITNHPSATILFDPQGDYTGINIPFLSSSTDSLRYRVPIGVSGDMSNSPLSLVDICGFSTTAEKIGKIADSKTVSEAVVAIPFIEIDATRKFFNINLEKSGESVQKQIEKMKKFVIPPRLDFVHNKDLEAIAMYIFEFNHVFDKDDLSHMWQNVLPEAGMKMEEVSSIISHDLRKGEILEKMPEELKWMVFKVKQRAKTDYWKQTNRSNSENIPFYSYNWPYDFFSLIEMVQIDSEVEMKKKEDISSGLDSLPTRNLREELFNDDLLLQFDPSEPENTGPDLTEQQVEDLEEARGSLDLTRGNTNLARLIGNTGASRTTDRIDTDLGGIPNPDGDRGT